MKGQKVESKWDNVLSLTPEKMITRDYVTCNTFGPQGLSDDCKCDNVGAILDTPGLFTLDALLNMYGNKFKKIFIIEMNPAQFKGIQCELNKRKSSLKSKKYENVRPIYGDVFKFLCNYKGQINYIWLDLTCSIVEEHEIAAVATKIHGLMCLAVTLTGRGRTKGGGTSVVKKIAKMYSPFRLQLCHNLLNIRYNCGGGPMCVFAFGRLPATFIEIKSLASMMRGTDSGSSNDGEYEEDSFCDMSSSSDVDEPPAKKSKRASVDSPWDLGRSYRMR